jgi:hypothetical protein
MRKGNTTKSEATKFVDAADLRLEPHPEFLGNVSGRIECIINIEGHELWRKCAEELSRAVR